MLNEGEICVFLRPKNSLDNTTFLISMKKLLLTALLTATCVVADAASEPNKPSSENPTVRLPRFISSGMVLQRGDTARVWGWADANTAIKVQFAGKKFDAVADADGRWSVAIPTTAKKLTGGPYKMTINELTLDDIWVGDVWLCSGQSNMDLHCARLEDLYKDETDHDSNPAIHLVQMGRTPQVVDPQDDVVPMGFYKWESMKPENVGHWSGIGYFYAKEMYRRTGVPQGIISASMGGSDIVAWCSEEVLSANAPRHLAQRNHLRTPGYLERNAGISRAISRAYNEAYEADDPGLNEKWMSADFDDSSWETVQQYDMNIGDENGRTWRGSLWFRKEFFVPDSLVGRDSLLRLGCLIDADVCYINGEKVGETGYQYPPRKYKLRANQLKAGRNVLCIRLKTNGSREKFVKDKPYRVLFHGGSFIDLEGEYKMHRGVLMPNQPGVEGVGNGVAMSLYVNVIHPLLPYRVAGILWYQGETNAGRPQEYGQLLPPMIDDWRKSFGNVPALIFGLANHMSRHDDANYGGGWALLREAQRLSAIKLDNAALVTLADLGEWNDIHPLNKKEAARRAVLQMLRLRGDRKVIAEGPTFRSVRYEGNRAIVTFNVMPGDSLCIAPSTVQHTSQGIITTDGKLRGFKIAEANGRFHWADAEIRPADRKNGTQDVVLTSAEVSNPAKVRYGWDDDPLITLYGSTGLPVAPFEAH